MVLTMNAVMMPTTTTRYQATLPATVAPTNPPSFTTAPPGNKTDVPLYLARTAQSCHSQTSECRVRLLVISSGIDSQGNRQSRTRRARGIERKGDPLEGRGARRPRAGGGQAHGGARVQARALVSLRAARAAGWRRS